VLDALPTPSYARALDQVAERSFDAGEYAAAHDAALAALADRPDDPALLRIAGRAAFQLGLDDAPAHLERAVALEPDDAQTVHDLALALVDAGRLGEAVEAFRRVITLRPPEATELVDLAYASYATGAADDALGYLREASLRAPDGLAPRRGIVAIARREGRADEALEAAREVLQLAPEDVAALLDLGDLSLELGRYDEAEDAFRRLRAADDEPEHDLYALHGLIETALRRGRLRRALDLAVDATRIDRLGRTTDVLAFAVASVFGESDREGPSQADVERLLAESRAEHRRLHEEALVL
jgi:Flp pilus assembly protein TadD